MQSLRGRSFCRVSQFCSANNFRLVSANVAVKHSDSVKTWQEIPGPSSLPIIGQLHHFLPGGSLHNKNHAMYDILHKQYGPIVKIKFLGLPILIIHLYDADAVETVVRGEDTLPARPAFLSLEYYRNNYMKDEISSNTNSTGLITEHGERWKSMRSKVNPIMLQPKRVKLYSKILDKVSEDMLDRLKSKLNNKNMIDGIRQEMTMWSLEAVSVVSLGQRLNCFDPNLPADSPAKKLMKNMHDVFYMAENLDLKPSLWRYFSTPLFKTAMKTYEEQWQLSSYFVKKRIEALKKEGKKPDDETGILEKLLDIDERTAVLMAGDSLFAGIDTVSNVVISILYFLAQNPEKQEKLREEIISEDPKQSYLKACIKEALRLIPITPANLRKVSKEYDVLGYRIPKDALVIMNHGVLCKMEEHYPKPDEFIPERWVVDKSDPLYYGHAHPFAYSPFGYGTRSCIGRRIAQLQMESFVPKIVRNFHVSWEGPPAEVDVAMSNYIKGDLPFVFKKLN
ncbi:unnamed protein product [Leptosia nina]|uniref:Cytochrome P450 CYP12A2-like n=1 Tax=Leptosia nina TaxID=320188 RepID=A0AAV1JQV2_9NEOP